jgi:glycosyltransferase involved in cell wall biosynthesis
MRVGVTVEQCWHRVPGGTATSILGLVDALAASGEVDVVGVAARHRDPPAPPFRPSIAVTHLALPRHVLYETWHAPDPLRWPPVQRATGPVDIVHATAVAVPPAGGAPLVVTIHDLAFLADPSMFTRHGLRFFRRGTDLARRHADLVLVPSEATAGECVAAGFDPARIRVVPWGQDRRAVPAEAADAARRRRRLPERYVLFVGTVEPRKNLARLVEAWRRVALPDVPLVLAGPDGWGDAGPGPDGAGIVALGFVDPDERDALYAGASVVAYPSLREGFGLPVLEAMAQGAPVLTSRGTATAEVAGDAAVLVDPTSVDEIAAGLSSLLDDEAGARALGERGRERARRFTWPDTAAATVAAYREVTEAR